MKRYFHYFMLAAATVAAFASCAKEFDNPNEPSGRMKTITVKADIATTKTTLDTDHANLVWSTGDQISIFNNINQTNSKLTYAAGGDLTVAVPEETDEIYAHYPYFEGNVTGPEQVSIYISNKQTQKNPGELNGYYFPMVAKGTVTDSKAIISLYPVASALALNIYHTGLSGNEAVKSVTVTPTANTGFIGQQADTDITADNVKFNAAASSNPITVTLTNALSLGSTKPSDSQKFDGQIYVCLAKQSYAKVKFEIETSKGTYTITSNSTPFDCVNKDFIPINIDLAKASFEQAGFVELDWEYPGGTASALNAVAGVSTGGLGSDYAATNAPYRVKMDSDDDYIQVRTDKAIGSVSIGCKMIGGTNTSYLNIYESIDGVEWGDRLDRLPISGSSNAVVNVSTTATFNSDSRYVKIVFEKGSNIGVGPITIRKADTTPVILASDITDVPALGVTNATCSYSVRNFTDDVEVESFTGCVTAASAENGTIVYSIAPNYTTNNVTGTISLRSASENTITATINVSQKKSTLSVSSDVVIIPANDASATFTVTTAEFGYSAIATPNSGYDLTVSSGGTGSSSSEAQTITVSSTTGAPTSGGTIDLGTIKVYRNGNTDDPQVKTVTIKKASSTSSSTVTLTNADIVAAGEPEDSYKSWSITKGDFTFGAYAIKKSHSTATNNYHFLQIKKYASSTAYYIHIPELGTRITSITMTVSSSSKPMSGGGNTATLFFSNSSSTSATGNGVASGTGGSTVTIDASNLYLNSGYITASGAVRIWDIEITYE